LPLLRTCWIKSTRGFERLEERLDKKFEHLEERLDKKFERLEERLDKKFEERLDKRFERLEERLDKKFERLDENFNMKFDRLDANLDRSIEATERAWASLEDSITAMKNDIICLRNDHANKHATIMPIVVEINRINKRLQLALMPENRADNWEQTLQDEVKKLQVQLTALNSALSAVKTLRWRSKEHFIRCY